MGEFILDTSGAVPREHSTADGLRYVSTLWTDLDAFTQGYVEALFHSSFGGDLQRDGTWKMRVGFSDLAPETLTRIMADCQSKTSGALDLPNSYEGKRFWQQRRAGEDVYFPPLAPYLGDGRVYLREAA